MKTDDNNDYNDDHNKDNNSITPTTALNVIEDEKKIRQGINYECHICVVI